MEFLNEVPFIVRLQHTHIDFCPFPIKRKKKIVIPQDFRWMVALKNGALLCVLGVI